MTNRSTRLLLSTAAMATVAVTVLGCASRPSPVNWQRANTSEEQFSIDSGECRRAARREVEREMGVPAAAAPADNIDGGMQSYNQGMDRYSLKRMQERLFGDCMRRLGYKPIVK